MARGTERRLTAPPMAPQRLDAGLPPGVTSHKSGGRDVWSEGRPVRAEDQPHALWEALNEVLDPELPVSLVELGLVYGARVVDGIAHVHLTFTATACPCMDFIRQDITDRLLREPWIDDVRIAEVWDPPWTTERITEEGRRKLRTLGVGA